MRITINKWDGFQPRKDRSNHTWFRVDNTIIFSEALDGLAADQKWFWICLLAYASKKQVGTFDYNINYFEKHFGLTRKKMDEALSHLAEAGAITFQPGDGKTPHDTITSGSGEGQTPEDTSRLTTDRQTDITNKQTDSTESAEADGVGFSPKDLANLWNEKTEALKEFAKVDVKRLSSTSERYASAKARLGEEPSREYWAGVIDRITVSTFCRGKNDRGWIADFDFLVRQSSHVKVMENKYRDRTPVTAGPAPIRNPKAEQVFAEQSAVGCQDIRGDPNKLSEVKELLAKAGNLGVRKEVS